MTDQYAHLSREARAHAMRADRLDSERDFLTDLADLLDLNATFASVDPSMRDHLYAVEDAERAASLVRKLRDQLGEHGASMIEFGRALYLGIAPQLPAALGPALAESLRLQWGPPAPEHTQDAAVTPYKNIDINIDPDPFGMQVRPVEQGTEVAPNTNVLNWRTADDSALCNSTLTALCSHTRGHAGCHEAINLDGTIQRRWGTGTSSVDDVTDTLRRIRADLTKLLGAQGISPTLDEIIGHTANMADDAVQQRLDDVRPLKCGNHQASAALGRFLDCTLTRGHDGDHEAHVHEFPRTPAKWPQTPVYVRYGAAFRDTGTRLCPTAGLPAAIAAVPVIAPIKCPHGFNWDSCHCAHDYHI